LAAISFPPPLLRWALSCFSSRTMLPSPRTVNVSQALRSFRPFHRRFFSFPFASPKNERSLFSEFINGFFSDSVGKLAFKFSSPPCMAVQSSSIFQLRVAHSYALLVLFFSLTFFGVPLKSLQFSFETNSECETPSCYPPNWRGWGLCVYAFHPPLGHSFPIGVIQGIVGEIPSSPRSPASWFSLS